MFLLLSHYYYYFIIYIVILEVGLSNKAFQNLNHLLILIFIHYQLINFYILLHIILLFFHKFLLYIHTDFPLYLFIINLIFFVHFPSNLSFIYFLFFIHY